MSGGSCHLKRKKVLIKNSLTLICGGLILLFSISSIEAEEGKLFPFPLAEAEKAVSDWLQSKGFQISRLSAVSGQVQIKGIKNKEIWTVFCQIYSPLASLIKVSYEKEGRIDQNSLAEFWFFIEQYGRSPGEGQRQATYPSSIFSLLSEAVVCIQARMGEVPVQFSGFIINEEGAIISTAHDLEKLKEVKIILKNGEELSGSLVRKDFQRDLSLIKVPGHFKNYILWREGRRILQLGEKVHMLSCSNRNEGEFIGGVVEEVIRQKNKLPLWRVNMETLPGSSGSPVFDRYGNLVGIVKGRLRGTDNIGFLIPLSTLIEFIGETPLK